MARVGAIICEDGRKKIMFLENKKIKSDEKIEITIVDKDAGHSSSITVDKAELIKEIN